MISLSVRVETIEIATRRGLTDVTGVVARVVAAADVREGLCTVFIRHTSASLDEVPVLVIQSRDGRVPITYTWDRRRIKRVVLDALRLDQGARNRARIGLLFYALKPPRRIKKLVNMRDQFANAALKVEQSATLCVRRPCSTCIRRRPLTRALAYAMS